VYNRFKEYKMQKEDTWIHSSCEMCIGDCGILVHRVDGVVVDIKGDPDCPNSRGKICSRGHSGIMTLYDPNRVRTPLRRTNPEKGLGVDPGWVPISWDEALDILEEKLTKVRKEDPRKLQLTTFDVYIIRNMMGAWAKAFGTPNRAWTGYYCGQYLHSSMYLVNGTFHCDFDADYINYLLLFGNQAGFGAGLNPNITAQKVATARKRGLKVVVVDPICTPAASKADEWVPIRPGTDGALILAIINVLLNDLGIYDREFIKRYTNGPYLVKPDGYYIRHNDKPLTWDAAEGKAKPYDAEVKDYAFEGSYSVDGVECKPAFQLLKEHVKKYTPDMAAEITTVPPATIRHLAEEFGKAARIGSTITVDGTELPYRPVAANIYRGAGAHKHGVAVALEVLTLNLIVGNFYVPGGHRGTNLVGPSWAWAPQDHDGLIQPTAKEGVSIETADYYTYEVKPPETTNLKTLYPIGTNWGPMCLATGLDPEKYKLPYKPEVLISCRRNLFMGGVDYEMTAEALKKYKFIAAFCITLDEMSEFADLVLPEAIYLEKLQAIPNQLNWSHTAQSGYFYWGIRQPVVPPVGEARDWGDVLMDLADRMGFLGDVYKLFNTRYELKEPYKLNPSRKYTKEEIADRRLKSEFGEEKGLEWFKKNGYLSVKRTVDELYPLPWLKVRFPLYYENIMDAGRRVKEVTESIGLKDWDISDYEALPNWKQCVAHTPSGDFDLKASNFRLSTHSFSWTAENPWLAEVAELNPSAQKILINTQTAKRKGIRDGDKICVESAVGKVVGEAKVTECIHPEVVGMSSHFGSVARGKPVAYGKGVNFNRLVPYDTDPVSTGVDACVRVKVYKV
jgi:anaerobic selenocysteine-containing dehydrogenase